MINEMKKVDLGCGKTKKAGYIGVDALALEGVDIVADLDRFPYPFADGEVDEVWMDQVLEHLENPVKVMEEIHRIVKNGAKVTVEVPYFRSHYAFLDPTHRHFFGVRWFDYFDPDHRFFEQYGYTKAKFKVEKREFDRKFKDQKLGFIHRAMIRLAERKPEYYEGRFSHLFPLGTLTFTLRAAK